MEANEETGHQHHCHAGCILKEFGVPANSVVS